MTLKIYQINPARDPQRTKFTGLQEKQRLVGLNGQNPTIDPKLYDEVYSGEVDCHSLEDVFYRFNMNHPPFHRGHSLSVSDVVQVIKAPELVGRIKFYDPSGDFKEVDYIDSKKYNKDIFEVIEAGKDIKAVRLAGHNIQSVEPGFYFCDSFGFTKIDFDPARTQKPGKLLRVVAKEPGKPAYETEVADHLKALQQAVRGYFEIFLLDNDAGIICNDEGRLHGMEPNIMVNDALICGPIFIVRLGGVNFRSLTDDQVSKYLDMFRQPGITAEEGPAMGGGMVMT